MKLHVRIEMDNGQTLEFTEADVTDVDFSTPYAMVDRQISHPRFELKADFPIGLPPRWSEPKVH